jgi:predicted O-linked N-acetylglucosamine transferase (SPINDLY family)
MLNALGRHEEEEKAARRAVDLDPGSSDAATSLANSLFKQEKFEEALFHYQRAAKISPHHPVARNNLGVALQRLERADEAIEEYRHAARLAPETPSYLTNLAGALCASGLYEEGLACYRKLRRLLSTPLLNLYDAMAMPIILSSHGQIAKARSHVQEGMKKLLEQDVTIKDPMVESHVLSFFLAYHGLDDRPLQEAFASFFRKACPSLTWAAPHCENSRKPEAGQRIKVGFVSSFFRETHTVGRLFKGLIAGLPRERFEVVLFPVGTRFSDQELSYHKAADRMVPLPKNLEDARQTIARERLDILYYPDIGMVPFTNFLAHARLAPVQCVAWGHPDTTGLPSLDYFVSAEAIEPEGAEAHYTEKLVALSRIPLCYTPAKLPAQGLKSRQELGLPEGKRLYVCTQSLFKVHPDMDAAFAKILAEDEKAVIVMISFRNNNWVNILKTRLARSIPRYKDRFHFSPALNHEDFLALNAVADALLDTFHFSGGLTTLEAFTVGQPVVTLPGDFMRGRVSLGYYRQMEMDELIARDADHYAALAVRLANDIPWREAMKAKILEKRKAVFEDAEGLRVFAEFLEKAVRRGA